MEFRKMVTISMYEKQQKRHWCIELLDSVGEGEHRMIWENGIETCIMSCMKWVASPGSKHDAGCLGLVCWDDPEKWYGEGGGFRMGNTCIPVADSFWYITKPIQYCKVKKLKKNWEKKENILAILGSFHILENLSLSVWLIF